MTHMAVIHFIPRTIDLAIYLGVSLSKCWIRKPAAWMSQITSMIKKAGEISW